MPIIKTLILILVLLVSAVFSLSTGPVRISPATLRIILLSGPSQHRLVSIVEKTVSGILESNENITVDKHRKISIVEKRLGFEFSPSEYTSMNDVSTIIETAIKRLSFLQGILWGLRIPRLLLGLTTGACLAASGAVFQGLLMNPLADPYILGVSSGAGLGAATGILFGFSIVLRPMFSFAGAVVALFTVYFVASEKGRLPKYRLLLAGIIAGSFFGAMIMLVMTMSVTNVNEIVQILMGSLAYPFTDTTWHLFLVSMVILGFSLLALGAHGRELDAMALGEESASHIGVETERIKKRLFLITSLMVGLVVSFSGLIGFVGLIVPHAVRMIFGPSHSKLIPLSALAGAGFLITADLLARNIFSAELPVGVVTALTGAPFFLYLLSTQRRSGEW